MKRYLLTIVILLVFIFAGSIAAEIINDDPEVVSLYTKGRRLMREGDWLRAARTFEELSGRFQNSPNYDLFVFNRSKSEYYFGDYNKAQAGFQSFVSRYNDSPYLAHAYFFIGNTQYRKGNIKQALSNYLTAYSASEDKTLSSLISESIKELIASAAKVKISADDFSEIIESKRCELMNDVAKQLIAKGETESGNSLLSACGQKTIDKPDNNYNFRDRNLDIAFVLPFSGELQTFADQIFNGATVAMDKLRGNRRMSVHLHPYDTKGDPVNAARIMKDLSESNIDVVVGPLTSEEAAVSSAILNCADLPLLIPAATQAGLTKLSEGAFQMSPNIELQAVRMAEYAITALNADSTAIITSTATDHLAMTRAFSKRFEELGGRVIAIEYYRSRDKDFGPYIRDIKGSLLDEGVDSVTFINNNGDTLHIDAIGVSLDCLYLPGSADQLRLLLPQLQFYNIQTKFLGSDGWGDDVIYKLSDAVTKKAVFPSPFLEQTHSEKYIDFASEYFNRYGEQPKRLASLGYDAISLIGKAVGSNIRSRSDINRSLSTIAEFDGMSSKITFGDHRENIEMPLYKIENGLAIPLSVIETIDTADSLQTLTEQQ